jgi:hypothetical protein
VPAKEWRSFCRQIRIRNGRVCGRGSVVAALCRGCWAAECSPSLRLRLLGEFWWMKIQHWINGFPRQSPRIYCLHGWVRMEWRGFKRIIGEHAGKESRPSRRQRNPGTRPQTDEASAKSSRLEGRRSAKDVAFFRATELPGSYKVSETSLKTVPFGSGCLSLLMEQVRLCALSPGRRLRRLWESEFGQRAGFLHWASYKLAGNPIPCPKRGCRILAQGETLGTAPEH